VEDDLATTHISLLAPSLCYYEHHDVCFRPLSEGLLNTTHRIPLNPLEIIHRLPLELRKRLMGCSSSLVGSFLRFHPLFAYPHSRPSCASLLLLAQCSSSHFLQQDISSYVIARTLGVVDAVKASTSDKVTQVQVEAPTIRIQPSGGESSADSLGSSTILVSNANSTDSIAENEQLGRAPEHPKEYFATDNLKLSGVGILSPAGTRPSSPVLTRSMKELDTGLRQRQQTTLEEET